MGDLRPPRDPFWAAFSVPATVRVASASGLDSPVTTSVIWVPSRLTQHPAGLATVADTMLRLAVRTDEVSELTIGSRVEAVPLEGGQSRTWTVRRIDGVDAERIIAAVA